MRAPATAGTRACLRWAPLLVALVPALVPAVAEAHAGRPPEPHDLLEMWRPPLVTIAVLAAAGLLYLRGARAAWRRAGEGRVVSRWRVHAFLGGLVALAIAVASPLDVASVALFSAHMVQHLVIVLVAAPLLAIGRAEIVLLWALPRTGRRAVGRLWRRMSWLRWLARAAALPAVAWLAHMAAIWAWHMPRLYDAAAASEPVHVLEHATFLVTAVLFARPLVAPTSRASLAPGASVLYLFAAAMAGGVLGALLTLAESPWYVAHLGSTGPWGLTPLEDQQLAGVLMWGPAGGAYFAAMLWEMRRMLVHAELATRRAPGERAVLSR
jgi:putative membrane protein